MQCWGSPHFRHATEIGNTEIWQVQVRAAVCRALNQAIGRCIRHKHDYGGIILLDQRFGDTRNQRNLSCWCAASHLLLSWRSHSRAFAN